jgi:dolichyl-phosphate beta-glucosyltransferase
MPPSLSIIIPSFNESTRLGDSLSRIFKFLEKRYPESEIIVVDDGSQDDTVAIAERVFENQREGIEAKVIRVQPNRGKGHAVRRGMMAAKSPIALFTDADLSTPIEETPKLVEPIRAGDSDVVFGSRALDRSLIGVHQPWRREQGGRFFNLVVRLATGLPYWDTQCGFKAFRMETFLPICEATRIDRFGFDVELLYVANLAGLRMKEVPVRWDHNEGSKLNVISDTLRAFNEIRTVRNFARKGAYGPAIEAARLRLSMLEERRAEHESNRQTEKDAVNSDVLLSTGTKD